MNLKDRELVRKALFTKLEFNQHHQNNHLLGEDERKRLKSEVKQIERLLDDKELSLELAE